MEIKKAKSSVRVVASGSTTMYGPAPVKYWFFGDVTSRLNPAAWVSYASVKCLACTFALASLMAMALTEAVDTMLTAAGTAGAPVLLPRAEYAATLDMSAVDTTWSSLVVTHVPAAEPMLVHVNQALLPTGSDSANTPPFLLTVSVSRVVLEIKKAKSSVRVVASGRTTMYGPAPVKYWFLGDVTVRANPAAWVSYASVKCLACTFALASLMAMALAEAVDTMLTAAGAAGAPVLLPRAEYAARFAMSAGDTDWMNLV